MANWIVRVQLVGSQQPEGAFKELQPVNLPHQHKTRLNKITNRNWPFESLYGSSLALSFTFTHLLTHSLALTHHTYALIHHHPPHSHTCSHIHTYFIYCIPCLQKSRFLKVADYVSEQNKKKCKPLVNEKHYFNWFKINQDPPRLKNKNWIIFHKKLIHNNFVIFLFSGEPIVLIRDNSQWK